MPRGGGHAARPASRTFRKLVIALSHGCLIVDAEICSVRVPTVRRLGVCSGADKAAGHLRSPPVRASAPLFSAFAASGRMPASPSTLGQTWRVNLRESRTSVMPCRADGQGNRVTGQRRATVEVDGAPMGPQPGALRSLQETAPPPGYRQAARGRRRRSITSARAAHWIGTRSRVALARPGRGDAISAIVAQVTGCEARALR